MNCQLEFSFMPMFFCLLDRFLCKLSLDPHSGDGMKECVWGVNKNTYLWRRDMDGFD